MLEALIISNIALWVIVIVLAGLVLVLVRQVGVLHERVAPAGALMTDDGPRVGDAAPVFELEDWQGQPHVIGGPDAERRSTLIFFLSPTCPICKTILPVVESVVRAEGPVRLVLASDGPRKEHEQFVREHRLDRYPYFRSTQLGLRYRIGKLPYAVLIDEDGIVRAKGLVNSREHLESLFEAKIRGIASVQEYVGANPAH
jgi:methylamine dehydrogenase accessory protein MauD